MFVEDQLCGFVSVVASSSTGEKDSVVFADFDADVHAGFVERHDDYFWGECVIRERMK